MDHSGPFWSILDSFWVNFGQKCFFGSKCFLGIKMFFRIQLKIGPAGLANKQFDSENNFE